MSKRTYRAVKINGIDEAKVSERVRGKQVVLGVDIAKDECFGRLMDEQREVVATIKWHQVGETGQMIDFLKRLPATAVQVAMESSGSYGDALRWQMQQAGLPVYRVSGKRCHDAAEVYDGVPSMHDAKAGDIIGKLHLDGISRRWEPKSTVQRELAAVVHTMALYDDQYHRTLNRIEARLARHWPELTTVLQLSSATLLALLEDFGGPQAVNEQVKEARALMRRVGGCFLRAEKIELVIASSAATIGVPMLEAERDLLRVLAREANRCRKAEQKTRMQVEQLSKGNETIKRLASTVGVTTAAVLVVAAGEPQSYERPAAYVKGLGLNLKERSSGKHQGQLRITKRGPSEARQYLYLAALRLIQEQRGDEVVRAWYVRKVARDGGRSRKKAVVAVMRKLAAALWHVGQGSEFDSSLLFDKQKLRRELSQSVSTTCRRPAQAVAQQEN